jgi:hypothetical protein
MIVVVKEIAIHIEYVKVHSGDIIATRDIAIHYHRRRRQDDRRRRHDNRRRFHNDQRRWRDKDRRRHGHRNCRPFRHDGHMVAAFRNEEWRWTCRQQPRRKSRQRKETRPSLPFVFIHRSSASSV